MTHSIDKPSSTALRGLARHNLYADLSGQDWPEEFPFGSLFSLSPVIERWRQMSIEDPATYSETWNVLESQLASVPELFRPIQDLSLLKQHEQIVSTLLRPLFAGTDWSSEATALGDPFGESFPYRTLQFERLLGLDALSMSGEVVNATTHWLRTMYGYKAILRKYYDIDFHLDRPIVLVVPDAKTGLNRYVKLNATTRFVDINLRGELPNLTSEDVDLMFQNTQDFKIWSRCLPPELFEFSGVGVISVTDVTNETATASIKHIVLTSDANVTEENFDLIENEMRNLYRNKSLRLGLASIQVDGELNLQSERRIWNSLLIREAVMNGDLDWRKTVYHQVLDQGHAVAIPEIASSQLEDRLKANFAAQSVCSLFLQPLQYDGRTVGLLELSSTEADGVNALTELKMLNIKSIFELAVFQNLERFESRVESIIQETYTAIHPSVAWRFREAAITMLDREKSTGSSDPEPILFRELYPLYGSADIRGSSEHRNEAIKSDILIHLGHAAEAATSILDSMPLTIIDELSHRIGMRIEQLKKHWNAGDEAETQRFIEDDVDPLLQSIGGGRRELENVLTTYRTATGSGETFVSQRRRSFEVSQQRINNLIVDMLSAEQETAQSVYPHYFEHAKTDGVEHTIYIGESIAPGHAFNIAYVQDLRLRQLIISCKIAREVHALNATIEFPLEISQLILVQDARIALQFKTDEKKFDVEGAAGIRFEILKKRLDKARVKDTDQRITQPNQIAIVYSHEREAEEYRRHIQYMISNGYLIDDVEEHDVEDLQGLSGLKMLRLTVRVGADESVANSDCEYAQARSQWSSGSSWGRKRSG